MELNIEMNVDNSKSLTKKLNEIFRIAVEKCANEWLNYTKSIISDNSVDTGEFLNSVYYKIEKQENSYIMTGRDAVKYGIYIEKGTVEHWVPFYKYIGKDGSGKSMYDVSQPILADWGRRVLGLSEEEMLKMGGMKVKHSGINAFEKGLIHMKLMYQKIFQETFDEHIK